MTPEERHQLLEELEETSQSLKTFYRKLIVVLVVVATGFAIFLFSKLPAGPTGTFPRFFFGLLFMEFLVWAITKYLSLARPGPPPGPLISFGSEKDPETGISKFTFRLGRAVPLGTPRRSPEPDASFSFGFHVSSLPKADLPDETALAQAEEYLAQGVDWDTLCARIQPAYSNWEKPRQDNYRLYLQSELKLRRARRS